MIRGKLTAMVICLALLLVGPLVAEDPAAYKADFISKLLTYVEWPAGSTAGSGTVVAVVGDSPIYDKLKALAASDTARKLEIRQVALDAPLQGVHVVFMATKDKAELAKILKKTDPLKILTISDAPSFAKFGVMVNFYSEIADGQEKIKFEVNKMVISAAGLKIGSQLLKLARVI